MNKQILIIQSYFNMWLSKNNKNIDAIFAPDIHYVECYGAEYVGISEIKQWMHHKFETQTVSRWDIKNILNDEDTFTVEWLFECTDKGKQFKFDGVSLITFKDHKITEIKEFESKHEHYRPYN